MKEVLIIGSGIAGLSCAIRCAEQGIHVILASYDPSERSQSVMASGGINAVLPDNDEGDTVEFHIEDTLKGGCGLGGRNAVSGLCESAGDVVRYLERIGTVFSTERNGELSKRAFGGQSRKRTYYCGASTGKQIVSALVMEARRFEAEGLIQRRLWSCFHSAIIRDGVCYGAILCDERTGKTEAVYADALVAATGGMNAMFGKTTGSVTCDGYTAGRLFMQGAELKNPEFIQYHPTTMETAQKRMLITEAVRGEGGRLFYNENGDRVYFMEDKYGPRGNLMTRDIVSREIEMTGREVFLDISFADEEMIDKKLPEVRELCMKYRGIDIAREPVPVAPSVHFFMGGLAVNADHETNIKNLYAIGECASMYHGANRLGGNSLLAALYGGRRAANAIARENGASGRPDAGEELKAAEEEIGKHEGSKSRFPVMYVRFLLADCMRHNLGIVRDEESLEKGIEDMDYYISAAAHLKYDGSVSPYMNYSLTGILTAARAVLTCAKERKESRGAHYRRDYPFTDERFGSATVISYDGGEYRVRLDKERKYES